jgi:hypothetical protein
MSLNIIKNRLRSIICWSVIAGSGAGSLISLDFGRKVARAKPLKNSMLTEEQRNFGGEHVLYVSCAWRLQNQKEVICTSTSSNLEGQAMMVGLHKLIGAYVCKVKTKVPGGDLEIIFENGLSLLIFADQSNEAEDVENYTFHSNKIIVVNGPKSCITKTKRGRLG